METISRNAPCPCGSGKRYKHCCGVGRNTLIPRSHGLKAHQQGALREAESFYRQALAEHPDDFDVMHMLGVLQLDRLRYREALALILEATDRTGWTNPGMRESLCRAAAMMLAHQANNKQKELLAETLAWANNCRALSSETSPLVSVVLLVQKHTRYIEHAIESVFQQTYPQIELIVIDNSSSDESKAEIGRCLAKAPIPARLAERKNDTAPIAFNEGAALAHGQYLAFLKADDYFANNRIARLVEEIARPGIQWGFSLVSTIQDHAASDHGQTSDVIDVNRQSQRKFLGRASNSFAFLTYNVLASTSNLFVARQFFNSLNGFRDHQHYHDWDFALRASPLGEPLVVYETLLHYREHENKTALSSKEILEERDQLLGGFMTEIFSDTAACSNPLAPQHHTNRVLLLKNILAAGFGRLVPSNVLKDLATGLLKNTPLPVDSGGTKTKQHNSQKTALVILGMHRSGTSALSRVLNLCGAFLPEKLTPPKLDSNPRGFWETEDIIHLNERILRQLGGAWNRVGFDLPMESGLAESFKEDTAAILAAEYGGQETILIKDPRICVLAPLWHNALVAAGYRPVYVVPVRNPIEVAQSLHARGDMSVPEGLSLWLTYMQRVRGFATTHPDVVHIKFTDLLDDWRGVISRIADRLVIPLDIEGHAEEVDFFLEPALRRQRSDEMETLGLDILPNGSSVAEVKSLYQELLAKCEQPSLKQPASGTETLFKSSFIMGQSDPVSTASFVLCIENNAIRDQALLLCESIRRFGGRHRNSPILAFSPRPGLEVDSPTRRTLANMDVEYVDTPLNMVCPEYGSANRVYSAAWAEAHTDTDFIVVLDSDTVFLDEPSLPLNADVAVRPVDTKGSATNGQDDLFENYWKTLAELCGIPIEQLPFLQTTIDKERIRASYNGGLIVTRRNLGILTRWADLFTQSVNKGLKPYRGHGMNVHASMGYVGPAASEYWGSNQAALALTIWASTNRVVHYPDSYNIPLHLIASEGEIDPKWQSDSPVHLHYHWMFEQPKHEIALELIEKLGVQKDRMEWLAERIPFKRPHQ